MNASQKHVLKVWLAAVLWMALIAIESTSFLSSDHTGRFLYPILHFLTGMDMAHFYVWHTIIRKAGHCVGYGVLSFLLFRAWRVTLPGPDTWTLKWAAIAFIMTASVASLDEWHQTFLSSRTGSFHDVLLDSFAALIAQILIAIFLQRRAQRSLAARSS